ncbi:unnamed protein product, partial [Rotaria sp. Silwood1]
IVHRLQKRAEDLKKTKIDGKLGIGGKGRMTNREEYDHNKHSLSLGIMKAIRPVFDELAHPDTLKKVINGGSQNSNESFHAVLWNLAPKTRYATGVVIDLCAAIAVLSFNDGDQSILPVIAELTGGGCGFCTKVVLKRLDERRVYYEHKQKRTKQEKTKLTKETLDSEQGDRMSLGVNDDSSLDDSYIPEFQYKMSNFDICYNALCRAFHKENVIMPPALVKILKPDDAIHSSVTLTNTSNTDSDSDTTTNVDTDSSDESDDSNDIDSNKSIQKNVNKGKNNDGVAQSG